MSSLPETPGQNGGINNAGTMNSGGGDIVGRDKNTYNTYTQSAEELVDVLEARGVVQTAEMVGLQRHVIIMLAERLKPEERLDFDQSITELKHAVEIALDVIKRGERGTSDDALVDAVLARVAEKLQSDDLDGGVDAINLALVELTAAFRRSQVSNRSAEPSPL